MKPLIFLSAEYTEEHGKDSRLRALVCHLHFFRVLPCFPWTLTP